MKRTIRKTKRRYRSSVLVPLCADTINSLLDPSINAPRHFVQRQAVVNSLDGALDGRRDELGAALDGASEVVDVAFPFVVVAC